MSEPLFDLYFSGQCIPNAPLEAVKKNLATVFKADAARIEVLFNGQPHCIKKGLDQAGAEKYQAILRKAGALIEIRPQATAAQPAAPKTMAERLAAMEAEEARKPAPPAPAPAAPAASPAATTEASTISDGQFSASTGYERLSPEAPPPPPAPDTSQLSTSEGYERLSEEAPPPPPAPDTGHLSLAETGTLMGEPKADAPAPVLPNLDNIVIAPPGADLLQAHERKPDAEQAAPDTSHLSIQ